MDMSIGNVVKNFIGLPEDDTGFDTLLLTSISNSILILKQLGCTNLVSPSDLNTQLSSIAPGLTIANPIIRYVCLKAQKAFDPSPNSVVAQALNDEVQELEFRLSIEGV